MGSTFKSIYQGLRRIDNIQVTVGHIGDDEGCKELTSLKNNFQCHYLLNIPFESQNHKIYIELSKPYDGWSDFFANKPNKTQEVALRALKNFYVIIVQLILQKVVCG